MEKQYSGWLTLRQCADYAQVSTKTLSRSIKAGRLNFTKVGGRRCYRLRPEYIDKWLESETAWERK